MEEIDEQALIELAKTNANAFGELYDRHYSKILNYIVRRVGEVTIAEDIATATFMKALDRLPSFKWQGVPFSAWLYRIASNEIANYFRDRHTTYPSLDQMVDEYGFEPVSTTDIEVAIIEAEEEIARHEQYVIVQGLIRTLPEKYQEALALRYFEKKSIEEISVIMGKRPGTIKSILSRGVAKIRQLYASKGITPVNATFSHSARLTSGDKKS